MKKSLLLYILLVGIFTALIWYFMDAGETKFPQSNAPQTNEIISDHHEHSAVSSVFTQFGHHIRQPLSILLLQIIVILVVSRLFGIMLTWIGQPSVVGEIIAGIVLGPSIMGFIAPEFSEFLFPKDGVKNLQFLSQIGLAFFMFIVGMELDIDKIRQKAQNAFIISHGSIIISFFLGVVLSSIIFSQFAPEGVSFLSFASFMGVALSITAFPVLARIMKERNITKTPIGNMVISCAAIDDITAWCTLAVIIAIAKAGGMAASIVTIVMAIGFVFVMILVVRPILKKISGSILEKDKLSKTTVAIAFFIMMISAFTTEVIGIHALFGAFMAGVVMPNNIKFKEHLTTKIEDVSLLLLLPIFFAFTGLRTQIGLLNQSHLWTTFLLVMFCAVLGKFGGGFITSKLTGQSWKDALSIGALMNTRGLMELIVLNIGYDLGILSPEIFAIMVLMALATTFMTGPSLSLINFVSKKLEELKAK